MQKNFPALSEFALNEDIGSTQHYPEVSALSEFLDHETALLLLPLLRIPHYSNFLEFIINRTKVRTTLSEVALSEYFLYLF